MRDPYLGDCRLSPGLVDLREAYFRARPEICIERARLVTAAYEKFGLFGKERISILDKARVYRYVLEARRAVVLHRQACAEGMRPFSLTDTSTFAGSTTSKFKGVPLYPEFLALALWPELLHVSRRKQNPYYLNEAYIEELNGKIFPRWLDFTIQELARKRYNPPSLKIMERLVFFLASKPTCISHTIPLFSRLITEGLAAIIAEAKEKAAGAADDGRREFYEAIGEVLTGMVSFSENIAAEARLLALSEADPRRKAALLELEAIHRRIPAAPPRTFREGLTAVWLAWIALHLENSNIGLSLGRLDQLLYPLYRSDRENGTLTVDRAVELLGFLWLKIGDHVPLVPEAGEQLFGGSGSNQAITIGGVDRKGADAVNDLTYVILRATELMKLRDPNLNARYHPGINPPEYLRRLCAANRETGATPAIHNDRAVIRALMAKGETIEEARDYGIIGCVEPGSAGRFYGHTGAILLNLPSALELALFNGRHRHCGLDRLISVATGEVSSFKTWEEFKGAFIGQVRWLVDQAVELNNVLGRIHQEVYPTPIMSAFFEGPLEKGRDVIDGGASINASGVAVIGLADVADSLCAVRRVVFQEGSIPFSGLLAALQANFEGYETLRARLNNPEKTPKFGNEDLQAEGEVRFLIELLDDLFGARENYRGGRYRVGYWSMTNHAGFGRLLGAMPSGRKAGESFASGITPVSGAARELTSVLNSLAALPAGRLTGGVALNLKLNLAGLPDPLGLFAATVEGYFDDLGGERDGGLEIQFNVLNRETLVEAVLRPEEYPELLVRVSGYTAYFRDLNPQMQKEIIDRTEYLLGEGRMIPWEPFVFPRERR